MCARAVSDDVDEVAAGIATTAALLARGWTDRVVRVGVRPFRPAEWPLTRAKKAKNVIATTNTPARQFVVYTAQGEQTVDHVPVLLGLALRAEQIQRPLDTGPAADDKVLLS